MLNFDMQQTNKIFRDHCLNGPWDHTTDEKTLEFLYMLELYVVVWLRSIIYGTQDAWTVPCCGQDVYRAQVPQHFIDSYNT